MALVSQAPSGSLARSKEEAPVGEDSSKAAVYRRYHMTLRQTEQH